MSLDNVKGGCGHCGCHKTSDENMPEFPYAVLVKYEKDGKAYSFGCDVDTIKKGDFVVVDSDQGPMLGEVEADAIDMAKMPGHKPTKAIVRLATSADKAMYRANLEENDKAFDICKEEIEGLDLKMNLLSASYNLDRSKVLFVYLADQRVDFRELLKHLSARLHCRIELRQIGERDKARMVGGIGMCGMECCCRRFKSKVDVISINMAKNQMLALNIDKLSGACGKLMCCLKYEDDMYKELTKGLPKTGTQVEYEGQIYRVTNMNVLSNEAKLENYENAIFLTLDDLREKTIVRKGVIMKRHSDEDGKPHSKNIIYGAGTKGEEMARQNAHKEKEKNEPVVKLVSSKENKPRHNHRPRHKERDTNKQVKNVTVRTFAKKKKEPEA